MARSKDIGDLTAVATYGKVWCISQRYSFVDYVVGEVLLGHFPDRKNVGGTVDDRSGSSLCDMRRLHPIGFICHAVRTSDAGVERNRCQWVAADSNSGTPNENQISGDVESRYRVSNMPPCGDSRGSPLWRSNRSQCQQPGSSRA
ncbi:hypothetical protein BS47DRAFT_460880 [Hydnum rufescens UP504]|uniref:Uncharacterized protein n=1 Tax=Hydnum rufescens UP504 TaxID=1448309 RepID=A0A9P6AHV2_9AGAM|nr:hypothetical protein BS47DRAFT_460880 [Hydnum rufescens UP504]